MDSYLQIIKYIYNKNNKNNDDKSIQEFFSNGTSFPQFVAIIFGIDNIPGIVIPKNKFHISNNNTKTLLYLGQNNPFFKSFGVDFNDNKNIISLINLIICKVYFKVNRTSFIKKCNNFLQSNGMNISSYNEFIQGNGFMKLMNTISKDVPPEINVSKNELMDQLIKYLNSLNIPVVINKDSLIPMNQDILMFQALIIIENAENISQNNSNIISDQINNKSENMKSVEKKVLFDSNQVSNSNCNQTNENDFDQEISKNNEKTNLNSINNDKEINITSNISQEQNEENSEKQIALNEIKADSHLSSTIIESSDIIILPKSSYLNIVNHIMEINNMKGIIYFDDFEKGVILPKLVEVLSHSKISNLVDNPEGYDRLMNNMSALYFINQNDPSFNPREYNLSKNDDIIDLLRVLLKKYIFSKEYVCNMKEECSKILNQYKISIDNFNTDWKNGINFIPMLNFLSNGTVQYPPNEDIKIDQLKDLFVKANCISIIENEEIFEKIDEFTVLYQVKIILDHIKKEKIVFPNTVETKDSLVDNSEIKGNNEKIDLSKNEIEDNQEITDIIEKNEKEAPLSDNNTIRIDESNIPQNQENLNESDNTNIHKYIYEIESCPILRMLNIIGLDIDLHYKSLDDIINGMTLPLLVKHIVGVDNIPGTKMSKVFDAMNLNAVFNFLRDKNTVFRYSSFDFNDKSKRNQNIIWFATTLLKQFYLTESKTKMLEKASNWIGKKILINDIKNIFHFGNGFYKMLGEIDYDKNYYDEKHLLECFQKSNVPFILDDDSLTNVNDDYICFQLKLIFDIVRQPSSNDHVKLNENDSTEYQISQSKIENKQLDDDILEKHSTQSKGLNNQQENKSSDDHTLQTSVINNQQEDNLIKDQEKEDNLLIQQKIDEIMPEIQLNDQKDKDQKSIDEKNENLGNKNDELNSNLKSLINSLKPVNISSIHEKHENKEENQEKSENDLKRNILHKEMNNSEEKIVKKANSNEKDDNYEFYKCDQYIPDNLHLEIDAKLTILFKETLNDILKIEDDQNSQKNYKTQNKQIEIFTLFEYSLNSWTFKNENWSQFLSNSKLKDNDTLYWILLPPSCTTEVENDNDVFYNLLAKITACKKKDETNSSNVCVEIGFCGSIKDIKNRFGIRAICTSNDYLAIVHIRYPSSFKNLEIIENMQSALNAKADYIVTIYSSTNINNLLRSNINSLYHSAVSNTYNLNNRKITFLFKESPIKLEESFIKIIHNPLFEVELDKKLNNDKIVLNQIKKFLGCYIVLMQWIDINDHETYNHFLETIIEHCQKNITNQNQLNVFNRILPAFIDIGSVNNQKDMNNFIYKIGKIINNANDTYNSVFNCSYINNLFINFNQNIWNNFQISNKIDENSNSLYTILFINSGKSEFDLLTKILINTDNILISNFHKYQAQIKYCGTIENIASNFTIKSKISTKSGKSHLAFLYINPPIIEWNDDDDILFFIFSIGLKCDLIITIPNEKRFNEQLAFSEKLRNLLTFQYRNNIENCPKQLFLFNTYQKNSKNNENIKSMMSKTPSFIPKLLLDIENDTSCSTFVSTILDLLLSHEKSIDIYNDYFYNINDKNQNLFFIKIFQDISIITKENNNDNIQLVFTKENVDKIVEKIIKKYYSNNNEKGVIDKINDDFANIYVQIIDDRDIILFISDIKSKTTQKVVYNMCQIYIDNFISCDMKPSYLLPKISEYINNRVTYIDEESIDILKDSCKEELKDFIYETVKRQCTESKYYTNSIYFMYENILERFNDKINECMKYIDECYEKIKVHKKENIVENIKEIEKDSMKYTLSVKESIKEMTIEITCDEDLEREIPTDY